MFKIIYSSWDNREANGHLAERFKVGQGEFLVSDDRLDQCLTDLSDHDDLKLEEIIELGDDEKDTHKID